MKLHSFQKDDQAYFKISLLAQDTRKIACQVQVKMKEILLFSNSVFENSALFLTMRTEILDILVLHSFRYKAAPASIIWEMDLHMDLDSN